MNNVSWFKNYDRGVPHTLTPYPQRTLVDIFFESASQRPNQTALLFEGRSISNSKLDQLSNAFAFALIQDGLIPGERVALLLPNTPQMVIAILGTWKAGGIVVPLNPLYTERELAHALHESGAKTVVVLTPFYKKLKSIQNQNGVRHIIVTNIKEFLPPAKKILFSLLKEQKGGHRVKIQSADSKMVDLMKKYRWMDARSRKVKPSDPAILLFSGGTTGTPKAALGTHQSLLMAGMQIRSWFGNLLIDWEDAIMVNMPLFHAYGLIGVFATALVGHNRLCLIPDPRDLNHLITTIEKIRPAFLPGVPTLFNALLNHPKVKAGRADLTSLKLCISGASSLLAETKQRFEAVTGGKIIEAYAMTESMLGATMSPVFGAYKAGSIGIPLPDVQVRITDVDTGQGDLKPGEVGEILLRAPQVMDGYWNKPEETAKMLRNGWLYTGDIGYQDEDGYVFIVDRKKDLIKPSGFQVWPRDVEEVIATHPAVAEVCVGGIPDVQTVEAVKAWVVLTPGHQLTDVELQDYCRKKLAAYKIPKFVEFRESLPKSNVGKILRRELVAKEKP